MWISSYRSAAALVLALSATAFADVITFTDGSRVVGRVEGIANGKITILTDFAGSLSVEQSKIAGITTVDRVHVEFTSGDTLVGVIGESDTAGSISVQSDIGTIPVPIADVAFVWPSGTDSPHVVTAREEEAAKAEGLRPKWSTVIEGGVTRREGNTDTLEAHGRFDVRRKTSADLLHFYLAGKYNEQNDKRTTNEYYGGVRYENAISDTWYWYSRNELEFDEFEGIDLRATAAVGYGYYWVKNSAAELKTSMGTGYRHESYKTGRTENDFVLDLGMDYRVDIADWFQFTHHTTFSPDVEDFDNYRLKLDTALTLPLKADRLSWKVGMRNEYNSRPQPGLDRLDNTYFTSIVLTLK